MDCKESYMTECAHTHTHTMDCKGSYMTECARTHTHTHMVVVRQEIFGSQAEQMEFTCCGQKLYNGRITER